MWYIPRIENHKVSCGMAENHDGLLRTKIMKICQIVYNLRVTRGIATRYRMILCKLASKTVVKS